MLQPLAMVWRVLGMLGVVSEAVTSRRTTASSYPGRQEIERPGVPSLQTAQASQHIRSPNAYSASLAPVGQLRQSD